MVTARMLSSDARSGSRDTASSSNPAHPAVSTAAPATNPADTSAVRLSCYSGAGFTDGLWNAQARGEVVLVDLRRLYAAE
ncbi:hypothetical protein [Streptomyces sp. NPDC048496]|uniref:hypothetical protein n=1 Tax=Streptomyces sp. NPDC048496 TaxID=3365558 RepID=UPI00371315B0